tara:strand:+ start:1124 stop:1987 length:864 start_codon:yes stop_codon:yes gene_type:complete
VGVAAGVAEGCPDEAASVPIETQDFDAVLLLGVALCAQGGLLVPAGLAVWKRRVAKALFFEDACVPALGAEEVELPKEGEGVAEEVQLPTGRADASGGEGVSGLLLALFPLLQGGAVAVLPLRILAVTLGPSAAAEAKGALLVVDDDAHGPAGEAVRVTVVLRVCLHQEDLDVLADETAVLEGGAGLGAEGSVAALVADVFALLEGERLQLPLVDVVGERVEGQVLLKVSKPAQLGEELERSVRDRVKVLRAEASLDDLGVEGSLRWEESKALEDLVFLPAALAKGP